MSNEIRLIMYNERRKIKAKVMKKKFKFVLLFVQVHQETTNR